MFIYRNIGANLLRLYESSYYVLSKWYTPRRLDPSAVDLVK